MFQAMRKSMPVPKPIERVVNALTDSIQPLVDVPWGVLKFATGAVKPYQGLRDLVAAFYQALDGAAPPSRHARGRDDRRSLGRGGRGRRRRGPRSARGPAAPCRYRRRPGDRRLGRARGRDPAEARRGTAGTGLRATAACGAAGRSGRRARRPRRSGCGRARGPRRRSGGPRRRGDEGRLGGPRARDRHRHPERGRGVPAPRREEARARLLDVGGRLGGQRGRRAVRVVTLRAAARGARRLHAREARGRADRPVRCRRRLACPR